MSKATQTQWRVEKKASTGRWIKRGLYETRSVARQVAKNYRDVYGFGKTRTLRYEKAAKK